MESGSPYAELQVIFSILDERQLLSVKDGFRFLIQSNTYKHPNYPVSLSGLNYLCACVDYELAYRRGKGIRIEEGEVVVCEKEESEWTEGDWREKPVTPINDSVNIESEEEVESERKPTHTERGDIVRL